MPELHAVAQPRCRLTASTQVPQLSPGCREGGGNRLAVNAAPNKAVSLFSFLPKYLVLLHPTMSRPIRPIQSLRCFSTSRPACAPPAPPPRRKVDRVVDIKHVSTLKPFEFNDTPWLGYMKMLDAKENLELVEKVTAHADALKGRLNTRARLICSSPYTFHPSVQADPSVTIRRHGPPSFAHQQPMRPSHPSLIFTSQPCRCPTVQAYCRSTMVARSARTERDDAGGRGMDQDLV